MSKLRQYTFYETGEEVLRILNQCRLEKQLSLFKTTQRQKSNSGMGSKKKGGVYTKRQTLFD